MFQIATVRNFNVEPFIGLLARGFCGLRRTTTKPRRQRLLDFSTRTFQAGTLRGSWPMRSIGWPQHGQALTHGARLGSGAPCFQNGARTFLSARRRVSQASHSETPATPVSSRWACKGIPALKEASVQTIGFHPTHRPGFWPSCRGSAHIACSIPARSCSRAINRSLAANHSTAPPA